MGILLYMTPLSPPVRAVLLTAEALGVKLETKHVDLGNGEHLTPEYKKINPQHTVPLLDDNGTHIWDSHAIIAYLASKYGKNDELYPKDLAKRAVVDQRLHFDSGMVFSALRSIVKSCVNKGSKTVSDDHKAAVNEALDFLDKFLAGHKWVAGDVVTIADLSLISSVSSLNTIVPVDATKYPNVTRWMKQAEKLPYYKVNLPGLQDFDKFVKGLMA